MKQMHKMCALLFPSLLISAFKAGGRAALHYDVNWSESLGMIKDFLNIKILSSHHKGRPATFSSHILHHP